jgi:hypothetical protein
LLPLLALCGFLEDSGASLTSSSISVVGSLTLLSSLLQLIWDKMLVIVICLPNWFAAQELKWSMRRSWGILYSLEKPLSNWLPLPTLDTGISLSSMFSVGWMNCTYVEYVNSLSLPIQAAITITFIPMSLSTSSINFCSLGAAFFVALLRRSMG